MKSIRFILPISTLLLVFLAVGCQKEEKSSIGFSIKATDSSAPDQTSQQPAQGPDMEGVNNDVHLVFAWDVAWVYVTGIDFSAEFIPSSAGEIKVNPMIHIEWQGNEKVDLMDGPRIFAYLELQDGLYRNIELQLTSSRRSDFAGPNFYLSGTYGSIFNGTPITVEVTNEFTMAMKSGEATLNTESNNYFDGLIEIALDDLFTGISAQELENAEKVDGVILISAWHNQLLYAQILANLQAKFFHEKPGSSIWDFHVRQ